MSKIMSPTVFFYIALACEAKPLIQKYRLKKNDQQHPFGIYSNENIAVIISGVGKVAMAGAVTYSMATFPNTKNSVLINLGIAGHKSHPVGSLYLVDKIIDAENPAKKFYPQFVDGFQSPSMVLSTVSKPHTEYSDDCLYDMEAAAFYEMATKFSTSELIHCIKIISDNQDQSTDSINAKAVSVWIDQKLTEIDVVVEHLMTLSQIISGQQPYLYQSLIEQYHFTVTAQIKLKTLLRRWDVVTENSPLVINYADFGSAKHLLSWLEKKVEERPFYL